MEAAIGPCTELVKCAASPAVKHLSYMLCYKKYVKELENRVDKELKPAVADMEKHIKNAQDNVEDISQRDSMWLENAKIAIDRTVELQNGVLQIKNCFKGLFSQRYRLGKNAVEEFMNVGTISKEGATLLNRRIPSKRPLQAIPLQNANVFESRQSLKPKILEAVQDHQMVGVWGMGGIGKTTLMKLIQEHVEKVNLFNNVAMATVSQLPKPKEIQAKIAEDLGLKLKGESIERRAKELYSRLTQGKNLVLLDDLWKALDLDELGIPHGEVSLGCKIVIATRSSEVCDRMNVQAKIAVQVLSEPESWELFERNVGDYDKDVYHEVAKKIVSECEGLPLAIVVLAKCLRNKSLDIWVEAAKQLKKSDFTDDLSPVFTCIKYSYDNLETEERKLCFLLFCMYPEDAIIHIEELLRYINGEEIFRYAETLNDLRGRLIVQVDKLMSSCLLLEGKYKGSVMVHDIVRDVGISIASEESNGFVIKTGMGLNDWPVVKTIGACLRMSLMKNDISELLSASECPNLMALSLTDNKSLTSISDSFFERMQSLVTLDLSRTSIPSLPQSISCLRTLLLCNCRNLKNVSGIEFLRQLEILDLSRCDLRRLPMEMKNLTKLKLLDLSSNNDLTVIPRNVISSLTLLEEFYMFESFSHWEVEGEMNRDIACFSELLSLPRLSTLHVGTDQDSLMYMDYQFKLMKLSKFKINLHDLITYGNNYDKILSIKVNDHKPVNEWVKVLWNISDELIIKHSGIMEGIFVDGDASLSKLKSLKMDECSMINLPSELMSSLQNLKSIEIWRCYNMKAINSEDDVRQLSVMCNNLEIVNINKCENMEVLFDFRGLREERNANILPKLKKIYLSKLPHIEKIWKGIVSFESIQNLEAVNVKECFKLSYLCPISMAQSLQQLEILKIKDCHEMVQIFGSEETEVNEIRCDLEPSKITVLLPRLKTLKIKNTKLLNLFISFPSLQTLQIYNCDKLEEVFKEDDSASLLSPLLTKIELVKLLKLSAIWKGFIPVGSFQNLKKVLIDECYSLSYIFPVSVVMSLQQLEILVIRGCEEMVHIFGSVEEEKEERETEEIVDEIVDTNCCMIQKFGIRRRRRDHEPSAIGDGQPPIIKAVLPRLKTLQLRSLEKLIGFCQQSSVVFFFPSLEQLDIHDCPYLRRLPCGPNSMPKLKEFKAKMRWFDGLELDDQSTKARLQSLIVKQFELYIPYFHSNEPSSIGDAKDRRLRRNGANIWFR